MSSTTEAQRGLALITIDPGDDLEGLRSWYVNERIPAALRVPGVSGVNEWEVLLRYVRAPQGGMAAEPAPPAYVVIYELDDVAISRSEAFLDAVGRGFQQTATIAGRLVEFDQEMNVTLAEVMQRVNAESETTDANGMMVVSLTPRREFVDTMHEWYDTVHLGELMSCAGFLRTRRYRAVDGIPAYFALYELDQPEALEGDRFKGFSTRKFEELPAIQQKVGPNMTSNICDVYRRIV